jgi:3'(2'), 5'-bisphosphate nucleotidase
MPAAPDDLAALAAMDDGELASHLAVQAGILLVTLRSELRAQGAPWWRVMDEGDAAAHHYLAKALHAARPDDGLLSEEGRDGPGRLSRRRVWVVDPLDGTNEFGEPGRPDWAVHVCLTVEGRPDIGAVSLPAEGLVFSTRDAPVVPEKPEPGIVRLACSRNHASYAAVVVAEQVATHVLRMGSAGAKAMAVVRGMADVYVHAGGMYEWDSAAPAAVALAAGLHVSRLDGTPLVYNKPDPWSPDLIICRPELADPVLDALWGANRSRA